MGSNSGSALESISPFVQRVLKGTYQRNPRHRLSIRLERQAFASLLRDGLTAPIAYEFFETYSSPTGYVRNLSPDGRRTLEAEIELHLEQERSSTTRTSLFAFILSILKSELSAIHQTILLTLAEIAFRINKPQVTATLRQIAERAGLSKKSVIRHLKTLLSRSLICRIENSRYPNTYGFQLKYSGHFNEPSIPEFLYRDWEIGHGAWLEGFCGPGKKGFLIDFQLRLASPSALSGAELADIFSHGNYRKKTKINKLLNQILDLGLVLNSGEKYSINPARDLDRVAKELETTGNGLRKKLTHQRERKQNRARHERNRLGSQKPSVRDDALLERIRTAIRRGEV